MPSLKKKCWMFITWFCWLFTAQCAYYLEHFLSVAQSQNLFVGFLGGGEINFQNSLYKKKIFLCTSCMEFSFFTYQHRLSVSEKCFYRKRIKIWRVCNENPLHNIYITKITLILVYNFKFWFLNVCLWDSYDHFLHFSSSFSFRIGL